MIKVFKNVVKIILCRILYRVEYEGKENIDMNKSCVFMANHVSSMDAAFIWSDIYNLGIMAKEELFKFKPLGWIFKKAGAFPIARGKKDFGHVFHAVNVVTKEKKNLLIFPEGTRKARLKNVKAKNGAVYIAATAGVEVIPVHITEDFKLFGKVKVTYGMPIKLEITKENIKDKELLTKETARIMDIIYGR
ncbi:MAG: 1-acyl-sn-glycerol-3-phosphate acyltransferase [Clostridia bacterium]|nr:1-acyl-sn-glycerol-3-phosphate acyltransferase [Clostridia bacterium]